MHWTHAVCAAHMIVSVAWTCIRSIHASVINTRPLYIITSLDAAECTEEETVFRRGHEWILVEGEIGGRNWDIPRAVAAFPWGA